MKKCYVVLLAVWVVGCSNSVPAANAPLTTPTAVIAPMSMPTHSTATAFPIAAMTLGPTPTLETNPTLQPGQNVTINSIRMIDAQVGWGLDKTNHILRTADGGLTWADVTPPEGLYMSSGFFTLDRDTAWATFFIVPYSGPRTAYVWQTTDGGKTWKPGQEFRLDVDTQGNLNPSDFYFPNTIQFIDSEHGWLLVNVYSGMHSTRPLLFETTDGGKNWITINDHDHDLKHAISVGFAFIDKQTGWYGQNSIPLKFGMDRIDDIVSAGGWKLIKTSDGGHSFPEFTLLPLPKELEQPDLIGKSADCGETRIMTIDAQTIAVEWRCEIFMDPPPEMYTNPPLSYSFFALTLDRGLTWHSFLSSGNEFFLDAFQGWRLLAPGQLQQTSNGGLDWFTIKSVAWQNAQFDFISEQEGWAVVSSADSTAFVHTVDGGKTWEEIRPVIVP